MAKHKTLVTVEFDSDAVEKAAYEKIESELRNKRFGKGIKHRVLHSQSQDWPSWVK